LLIIRKEQKKVFEEEALKKYEDEMLDNLKIFAPKLFNIRGELCFRELIRLGIKRAEQYGLTNRGPIRFYIETMISLGCDFDTDPQFPWAEKILNESNINQMIHADKLYKSVVKYMHTCVGHENQYAISALQRTSDSENFLHKVSSTDFTGSCLNILFEIHPEKFEYVGEKQLIKLIDKSTRITQNYRIDSTQGKAFIVVLMFALGHGILNDVLYPWVKNTMENSGIEQSEDRIKRLYSKTRVYFDATLKHLIENTG